IVHIDTQEKFRVGDAAGGSEFHAAAADHDAFAPGRIPPPRDAIRKRREQGAAKPLIRLRLSGRDLTHFLPDRPRELVSRPKDEMGGPAVEGPERRLLAAGARKLFECLDAVQNVADGGMWRAEPRRGVWSAGERVS